MTIKIVYEYLENDDHTLNARLSLFDSSQKNFQGLKFLEQIPLELLSWNLGMPKDSSVMKSTKYNLFRGPCLLQKQDWHSRVNEIVENT